RRFRRRVTLLLDVNVLISLAWPNHVHHMAARAWFRRRGRNGWATTPVTEMGFVRVSSNVAAIADAVTSAEAFTLLARMRSVRGHLFLPDDIAHVVSDLVAMERVVTHRMVTDAHLLAVARRHHARLA